ncbi:hypothetical protein ACFWGC_26580 [Cytobacillus pseudoceanisediminis]|uniref:hypothetical protein n=1 Tax=Cytobacillus pseudoceanisediminis TaxID=3051614 RepID=UPI0036482C0B
MYKKIEEIFSFEFGFYYSLEEIEVIAIHHPTNQVRTLGNCTREADASFILETCIQYGFQENGMVFHKIPGYQLKNMPELIEV